MEEEFEVEKIIGKRKYKNKIKYLVKWKGYPESEATWEPASNLKKAHSKVEQYEKEIKDNSLAKSFNHDLENKSNRIQIIGHKIEKKKFYFRILILGKVFEIDDSTLLKKGRGDDIIDYLTREIIECDRRKSPEFLKNKQEI